MFNSTRILLDQHIRDCVEDRKATTARFAETSNKLDRLEDKLDRKFDEVADRNALQHRQNQQKIDEVATSQGRKLDKLAWYIAMGAGAVGLIMFLSSDLGRGILSMLQQHPGH